MKATIPVFVFLLSHQCVYLQRRYQTGYLDGYYEPPAGKVDENEFPIDAACREAREESGVLVEPGDLELFHTYINTTGNQPWLGILYRTTIWQGTPRIQEPHKCDHAGFFSLDNLPKITPQVKDGLARIATAPAIHMDTYSNIDGSS